MISPYKTMWLLVGFDLPTRTKTDKRLAANFRKDLLKLGFTRLQFSLYSYYAHSKEKADSLASLIEGLVPQNGHITIFFLTDRQFAMTKDYYGGLKIESTAPEQGLLLF